MESVAGLDTPRLPALARLRPTTAPTYSGTQDRLQKREFRLGETQNVDLTRKAKPQLDELTGTASGEKFATCSAISDHPPKTLRHEPVDNFKGHLQQEISLLRENFTKAITTIREDIKNLNLTPHVRVDLAPVLEAIRTEKRESDCAQVLDAIRESHFESIQLAIQRSTNELRAAIEARTNNVDLTKISTPIEESKIEEPGNKIEEDLGAIQTTIQESVAENFKEIFSCVHDTKNYLEKTHAVEVQQSFQKMDGCLLDIFAKIKNVEYCNDQVGKGIFKEFQQLTKMLHTQHQDLIGVAQDCAIARNVNWDVAARAWLQNEGNRGSTTYAIPIRGIQREACNNGIKAIQGSSQSANEVLAEYELVADEHIQLFGMATFGRAPDRISIGHISPHGWAENHGVEQGDELVALNGWSVSRMSNDEMTDMMKRHRPLRLLLAHKSPRGDNVFSHSEPTKSTNNIFVNDHF